MMGDAGRNITVIGGLPEPVGGVTAFVSRLAENNMISEVVDIYPSPRKHVPSGFKGDTVFRKGFSGFLSYYFANYRHWAGRLLHFNFSTAKAIVFSLPSKVFLQILLDAPSWKPAVGERQEVAISPSSFQARLCILHERGASSVLSGSWRPGRKNADGQLLCEDTPISSVVEAHKDIEGFFDGSRVLVASGYPSSLYNHEWCIDYVSARKGLKLAIFLYGSGDAQRNIEERVDSERVRVFWNCNQDTFNHALSRASVYLRPTSKDSFGVAVADAVELGVPVVASDVCKRYPGAGLFPVGDFSAFCETVDCILNGTDIRTEDSEGFRAFSYSDLDLRDV